MELSQVAPALLSAILIGLSGIGFDFARYYDDFMSGCIFAAALTTLLAGVAGLVSLSLLSIHISLQMMLLGVLAYLSLSLVLIVLLDLFWETKLDWEERFVALLFGPVAAIYALLGCGCIALAQWYDGWVRRMRRKHAGKRGAEE